ncbi:hypothetical protein K502DRAFT_326640, partial [Neoconidiobolus thromboides FSU 785]
DFNEVKLTFKDVNDTILNLTDNKWRKVPTLKLPDGSVVYNSRDIANELEKRYPNQPKLFPNGTKTSEFLESYIDANMMIPFGLTVDTEWELLEQKDKEFAEDRFQFARTFSGTSEKLYPEFEKFLKPIISMLKVSPFFEGNERNLFYFYFDLFIYIYPF